jgi:hypothetical protein
MDNQAPKKDHRMKNGIIGRNQIEGQPVKVLRPGDAALRPPGEKHWQGGNADT